jgi:hypothetical protein
MIAILSSLFFGLLNMVSYAQVYSDTTWERLYFGPDIDENTFGFKHIETYDKAYCFSMYEQLDDGLKPMIVKTDINGYYLWDRVLDTTLQAGIYALTASDNDGSLYLSGSVFPNDIDVPNPWVVKLNACMEVEWCKIFEWNETSYANDIEIDNKGDIIVLTMFYGHSPGERINLIKLSPDGDLIWKKNYATMEDHPYIWNAQGNQLIISEENDYYITGQAWWPTNNDPNQGSGLRSFFVKVAPDGKEEWVMPFGIYDGIYGRAKYTYQFNDTLFLGIGSDFDLDEGILIWYSNEGEIYSYTSKDPLEDVYYYSQIHYPLLQEDNTLWCILFYRNFDGDDSHKGYIKIDTAFNVLDYMEDDRWRGRTSLIQTFNNKFITVAAMQGEGPDYNYDVYISKRNEDYSFDTVYSNWSGHYDTLCDHEIISGYLPYECETVVVGMEEVEAQAKLQTKELQIVIKPNPTQAIAVAEFENLWYKELQMQVISLTGKEQTSQTAQAYPRSFSFNTQNYPSGMYFVVLRHNGKIVGSAKFVKE